MLRSQSINNIINGLMPKPMVNIHPYIFAGLPKKKIGAKEIIHFAAQELDLNPDDILGKKRLRELVEARMICAFLIINMLKPKPKLEEIGKMLGGKDHSTIVYYVRIIKDLLTGDKKFKRKMKYMQVAINELYMYSAIKEDYLLQPPS